MMHELTISLSPDSCRAARQLLRISQQELAAAAGISVSSVRRIESGEQQVGEYARKSIVDALHRNGIQFVGASNRPELR